MKYSLKRLLTESLAGQAERYFGGAFGFEYMSRRDVPSKEQIGSNRDVYYGKYLQDGCETIFQLEMTDIWDIVNQQHVDVIWIHGIRTLGDCQGKGGGTHVMHSIIDFADSVGLGVAGSVVPYGLNKMTREEMMAFDGRFGLMPLSYWKQFVPQHILDDENELWELEDFINEKQDLVWRPAGGTI